MFKFNKFHYCAPDDEGEGEGGGSLDFGSSMQETLANLNKPEGEPTPPTEGQQTTETPAAPTYPYPKSWSPEHADKWNSLTPEHDWLRQTIQKREDDFHKGLEQYRTNAQVGERYTKLWERYNPVLQQHGIQAEQMDQMVQGLLNAQFTLALGTPEEKLGLMRDLLSNYQIDPKALLEQQAELDPNLAALQKEVQTLKSTLSERQQAELNATRDKARAELESFTKDKPDFNLVANHIAAILQADPKATLQDAYEQAIWANPATREKAIKEKAAADAKAAEEADRKRAEEAARANAGSVRTPSRSASETAPTGSMDDTMKETLQRIKERG